MDKIKINTEIWEQTVKFVRKLVRYLQNGKATRVFSNIYVLQ